MARKQNTEDIVISSWDEWFENCGAVVPLLTDYENLAWSYYEQMYAAADSNRMSQMYAGHHASAFYRKEPVFAKHKWKTVILKALIGLGVGTLVFFVLFLILGNKKSVPIFQSLIKGFALGLLTAGVVGGITYALIVRNVKSLMSKMDSMEEKLKNRLKWLPPKYRNSIATGYLYDVYLNYPGVVTFHQALQELDAWFGSLPRSDGRSIGKTIAFMFDLSYEHTGMEGDAKDERQELYHSDTLNPAMSNENLPKDIASKTFAGVEDADKKLASMIGLTGVKKQVSQMKNRMKFYSSTGGRAEKISGNHMCFLGSPGTGKTTIARIITRILYDFGYIKENKCVELDGSYFKSPYTGQTAMRTQAIIDYAMGGVLFIDEAYLMMDASGTTGSAGTEATGTLLKNMEDRQTDFVVIFAGYEDAVNRLLGSNEGFASRIKHKIYFQDFSLDELMQIFALDMKTYSKNGTYSIEPEAKKLLEKHFDAERQSPTFGNARVVRNALDMILDVHADRFMNRLVPQEKKFVFTVEDIQEYISVRSDQLSEDARNYIASQNLDNSIISFAELKGRTKEGSADPDKDLNALTGLNVVKDEIRKMKAQFDFYDGGMGNTEGHHMCFVGAPGTGKSTVAGIMTAYLHRMGIIQRNEYLDINGDFLRGMYLGHTGKRTEAVIQYCQGMVLFVDEAYLLQQNSDGDNFGQEAIGVLLDAMEKHRKNFVVIVAGYDKEMNAFLNANSGLRSRISMTFHFQSYTSHELAMMMNRLAKTDGFKVEAVKQSHIMNFADGKYPESMKFVVTKADVEPVFGMNIQSEEKEVVPVPPDYPDAEGGFESVTDDWL